jgi:hypothetical protein
MARAQHRVNRTNWILIKMLSNRRFILPKLSCPEPYTCLAELTKYTREGSMLGTL